MPKPVVTFNSADLLLNIVEAARALSRNGERITPSAILERLTGGGDRRVEVLTATFGRTTVGLSEVRNGISALAQQGTLQLQLTKNGWTGARVSLPQPPA